jgi:hypothetical protein
MLHSMRIGQRGLRVLRHKSRCGSEEGRWSTRDLINIRARRRWSDAVNRMPQCVYARMGKADKFYGYAATDEEVKSQIP